MRILQNKLANGVIVLMLFMCSHTVNAELIDAFNRISVTKNLRTLVEFDQESLKKFSAVDNLKLRVMDGKKFIREDVILTKKGVWSWNKALLFSDDLIFVILRDNQPISREYFADTKGLLNFSDKERLSVIRAWELLSSASTNTVETQPFLIPIAKEFENCKDKVLVVVFNKETNILLWQYYGVLKKGLSSTAVEISEEVKWDIISDEGSCGH